MFYGGADNRFTSTASFTLNEILFFRILQYYSPQKNKNTNR